MRILLALLGAVLLAGCAAAPPAGPGAPEAAVPSDAAAAPMEPDTAAQRLDPPSNDQQSLVFGYLDMSEAPTPLGWMEFRQVAPRTERAFYQMRVHEGVFYMEKFPPGVFVMGEFGGQRPDGKHLAYTLPRTSPAVRVAIDTPGLHFLGAFKYRAVRENGVRVGRFEIDKAEAPSEPEVLARILPFARGTPWEARIQARLSAVQ